MKKENRQITEARNIFECGIKANPTNAHLYLAYAEMEGKQKYWRHGLAILKRGITVTNSQNAPLFQMLGRIFAWLYRFDLAEAAFKQGLTVDPTHAPIFQQWAYIKGKNGDKNGVEIVLREGCSKCPNDFLLHMTLAQFLITTGRQNDASSFINRALELCGTDQIRIEDAKQMIFQQPFKIGKTPDFHMVSQDNEGVIEKLVPIHPYGKTPYGFITSSKGDRLWFRLLKENVPLFREGIRVFYDLIEYRDREANRFVAINIEVVNID